MKLLKKLKKVEDLEMEWTQIKDITYGQGDEPLALVFDL